MYIVKKVNGPSTQINSTFFWTIDFLQFHNQHLIFEASGQPAAVYRYRPPKHAMQLWTTRWPYNTTRVLVEYVHRTSFISFSLVRVKVINFHFTPLRLPVPRAA